MTHYQTFWHFTTHPIDLLRQTGLQPYPLDPTRRDFEIVRRDLKKAKGEETGIWLWVNYPTDELIKDFLLWKITNGQEDKGTLLEVSCPPDHLLSHWLKKSDPGMWQLSHSFGFETHSGIKRRHKEPFDICMYEIRDFIPIARVEISITRFGQLGELKRASLYDTIPVEA